MTIDKTINKVALDFDGTILDSMPYKHVNILLAAITVCFEDLMNEENYETVINAMSDAYFRCTGKNRFVQFEEMISAASDLICDFDLTISLRNRFSARYSELNESGGRYWKFFESAESTLLGLREKGYMLYIASSVPLDELKRALSGFGVEFNGVYGYNKENALREILNTEEEGSTILYVGDTQSDQGLAEKLKIPFFRICSDGDFMRLHDVLERGTYGEEAWEINKEEIERTKGVLCQLISDFIETGGYNPGGITDYIHRVLETGTIKKYSSVPELVR